MVKLIETYGLNEKISSWVSYGLVVSMLFCVSIAARNLIARILPDQNTDYLPYFCVFVSLTGIYSQHKVHRSSELDVNPLTYRVVEWVVYLVLLKLAIYTWNGFSQVFFDLPQWQGNFLEVFFSAEYILSIMIVMVVWSLALIYVDDLIDLEGDVTILQSSNLDMVVTNRSVIQGRMANRIMTVGIGLVILATLSRLDYSTVLGGPMPAKQSHIYVLVYFLLGLMLLSLTQLATRRAVWAWEHIPVGEGIARNWVIYSCGFLVMLSLIAFALPTNFTLGFLPTVRYFLGLLFGLAYMLVLIVLFPIYLVIGWLISLFGAAKMVQPLILPEAIVPPLPEALASSPSPLLAILKSLIFWGTLLAVVIYAFAVYLRQNKELMEKLRRLPGLSWLVNTWLWLVTKVRGGIAFIPNAMGAGLKRLRSSAGQGTDRFRGGYVNLRQLDARQKIFFYYLAFIRRSGEAGLPRKPWQTPGDYAKNLEPNLPGAENDIEVMTQAFVESRYTQHVVRVEQVGIIQGAWAHLRALLNDLRKRQ